MRPRLQLLEPSLIASIVDEAKRILAEVGMEIRGPELRRRLLDHGLQADATGTRRDMFTISCDDTSPIDTCGSTKNALSDAIGMSVVARTWAWPALSSAVTGSSNQARLQSSTSRQKRFASATDSVPWASHISPTSGPSASRAALTRVAEWRGSPSMMPTRILTAPNPPAST